MKMKRDMKIEDIAKDLPIEFEDLIRYARFLNFADRPDYGYLRKMMDAVFYRANFIDLEYDWKMLHVILSPANIVVEE
jgi:hypothetical protein